MKEKKEYMDLARWPSNWRNRRGQPAAEALISDSESVQIGVSGRQVEPFNAVREAGIGVRVLESQKMAFGSSNDLSRIRCRKLVTDLVKKVVFHTPDEFKYAGKKPEPRRAGTGTQVFVTYDPQMADAPVQDKIKRAIRLRRRASITVRK